MNIIKQVIASLLYFVIISTLLIASCVGPGVMYSQSPKWFLDEVNVDEENRFFVAFISNDNGLDRLNVVMHKNAPEGKDSSNVQYYLPEEHMSYSWGNGDASIYAKTEPDGSQIIQVFVVGDTPWSSLSEYRVVDNNVHPLRHAGSVGWLFLLGVFICFFFVARLSKPIKYRIKRLGWCS
ncbi:MAG: hypothetical protein OEY06_13185 [Gammaproteobacteria bacterium]|nr:hypothetical protein [Gammaproteobacteria bacterium]